MDRSKLPTEERNPATADLDRLGTQAAVALIQAEDRAIHAALALAQQEIAAAVELIAARLATGGRLFYLGAGTSGRLAMLDAVECPPTFQSAPELVQAVIAGGSAALTGAVEGAEDDESSAARELELRGFSSRDVLFGIAASGTTPFVRAGLEFARARGAATVFLACVPRALVDDRADVSIRVVTGPEVLTGSTRLKAGTATKLVLNTISTLVMVRLGKVHGNRMVAVHT
ncbi:MAG: N-acetylmuramic acid 6-phosphate etherase, partial [Planctomycetota bacterium]